ncbi:MAG: DUF2851 family protein [Marinilabiliales bacterium]|nr:MAG: DUF2851 family protein [Marinilabiliales bacterium]
MTEDFLHYIWKKGLYQPLFTVGREEERIEVLSSGERNNSDGPDFFNALIRIGGILLAGNIEIHVNSSDWIRHGHHNNRIYDTVILQLVINPDAEVKRTNGEDIPTAVLKFDETLRETYNHLLDSSCRIACQPYLKRVRPAVRSTCLDRAAELRLDEKAGQVRQLWYMNNKCWEETFYQQLARNFGFRLNSMGFELVARSLPYKYLLKHSDSLLQLEAMIFGQAGFLSDENGARLKGDPVTQSPGGIEEGFAIGANVSADDYYMTLRKEYSFLKRKYGLEPVGKHLWKFLRLRPANFPTIRLAQFASFICEKTSVFSSVVECRDIRSLTDLFSVKASGYWDTRFLFNRPSKLKPKNLGAFAVRSLIINAVAPVLAFYGKYRHEEEYYRRAVGFLKMLPPEYNSIVALWSGSGINPENAWQSQALLQLKNEFCAYRRCLECEMGTSIIFRESY